MSVNPFHPAEPGPFRHWAGRLALPFAGVVAGTVAGFAVAALVRRPGRPGGPTMELAPEGSTIEFDKGGVWLARQSGEGDDRSAGADVVVDEIAGGLPATGIRPTFEVDAELARELATDPATRMEQDAGLPVDAERVAVLAR